MKKIIDIIGEKKIRKIFIVITACLVVTLTGISVIYGWFTSKKSIETIARINTPFTLILGSGNGEAIQRLDMGDIDAQPDGIEGIHRKQYVFSVASPEQGVTGYVIQLAHTTNIPFRYRIYRADEEESDEFQALSSESDYVIVPYLCADGEERKYGFKRDESTLNVPADYNVYMKIMNPEDDSELLADQSDYKASYNVNDDTYEYVQKNARPLYHKSVELLNETGYPPFLHNYILEIEWETGSGNDKAFNNKETDMVYLMAMRPQ